MYAAKKGFVSLILEFTLLSGLVIVVPYVIYLDVMVLNNGVSEYSLTEILQQLFILSSAVLFFRAGMSCQRSRSFLFLISGFFACMFIRECDVYFDYIVHGFWVYPALAVAMGAIFYAVKNDRFIAESIRHYQHSRSYFFILIGLVLILVFSRIFGSGNLMWEAFMGSDYNLVFKNATQEGLELLGYSFVFYGALSGAKNLRDDYMCA